MSLLLEAALGYADIGWRIHPCRLDKTPLTRSWIRDATTDPDQIRAWWRRWPRANVAVATGYPGPDVLDVDTKNGRGGMALYDRAREAGLLRGASAMIATPSGGFHIWFEGTAQTGSAIGTGKALELKATGGYVLLPPSYVETAEYAGHYELVERYEAAGTVDFAAVRSLLEPPRNWVQREPSYRRAAAVDSLARWLAGQPEGNRNAGLFWAACRALEAGNGDLREIEDAAAALGLTEREIRRTVESARRTARPLAVAS